MYDAARLPHCSPEGGAKEKLLSVTHVVAFAVGVCVHKDSESDEVVHVSKHRT